MNWREHIVVDSAILAGKPVVKGTRLSVDFLLNLRSVGWTADQILDSYPNLTRSDLDAVSAYAAECELQGSGLVGARH